MFLFQESSLLYQLQAVPDEVRKWFTKALFKGREVQALCCAKG
jgi:hypothetical protein